MLILTRRENESFFIGDNVKVTILSSYGQVQLGIEAPKEIVILRDDAIKREKGNKRNEHEL